MAALGPRGGPPAPPLDLLADFGGGGMLLAVGVLSALLRARESGCGQVVDAAMVDGAALLATMIHGFRAAGEWSDEPGTNLLDGAAPFYRAYECADGGHVAVGAIEPRFYAQLLTGLGLDADDLPGQYEAETWPTMAELFATSFRQRTRDEWAVHFSRLDACVSPVLTMEEAPRDPMASPAVPSSPTTESCSRRRHRASRRWSEVGPLPSAAATTPPLVPLAELLARTRAEHADRLALVDSERSLTYRELGERAARLASALHDLGARAGDRVILAAPNRCEWVEAEHALAFGGLVRVALIPRLHPRELAHIAADCEPFAVIAEREWIESAGLDWLPESTRKVIVIGSAAGLPGDVAELGELIDATAPRELPAPAPDDLAGVWYTSGSTGLPKGVLCTHRTFGASTRNILSVMPLRAGDVALHTAIRKPSQ